MLAACGGNNAQSDTAAPVTTDDAPSGWIQATSATVHLNATDDSGVAQTCYTLDDGKKTCAPPPLKVAVSGEGVHSLSYFSVDSAGNAEAPRTVALRLDGTAPTTSENAPAAWIPGLVYVILTPTDAVSGVDETCYTLDSTAEVCSKGSVVVVVSGDGEHVLTYHSVDQAGNVEASRSVDVKVQRSTRPLLKIDAPRTGSTRLVKVGCVDVDDLSGIDPSTLAVSVSGPAGLLKVRKNKLRKWGLEQAGSVRVGRRLGPVGWLGGAREGSRSDGGRTRSGPVASRFWRAGFFASDSDSEGGSSGAIITGRSLACGAKAPWKQVR